MLSKKVNKVSFFKTIFIVSLTHVYLGKTKLCLINSCKIQPLWLGGRACGLITDFSLSRWIHPRLRIIYTYLDVIQICLYGPYSPKDMCYKCKHHITVPAVLTQEAMENAVTESASALGLI